MMEQFIEVLKRRMPLWRARFGRLHSGWCVLVVVAAGVCVRQGWVLASRPARVEEIAAAYGSAGLFYGCPQMDAAGARICYVQQSRSGRAVCVLNLHTGEREEIQEEEKATLAISLEVWPWSPDGNKFIYAIGDTLFLWAVDDSGIRLGLNPGGRVTDLVWLGADRFVCVVNRKRVCHIRLNRGKLELAGNYLPVHKNWNLTSLNVMATNAVSWLNSNQIWRLEVNRDWAGTNASPGKLLAVTNPAQVWLDPLRNDIGEFAYSPERGEVLFTCAGGPGELELWRWDPGTQAGGRKMLAKSKTIGQIRWLGKDAYAYVASKSVENRLLVGSTKEPEPEVLALANVNFLGGPPGGRMVIMGVSSNDISEAIWEYDLEQRQLKRLVAATASPSALTQRPCIGKGACPMPGGGRADFYIVRPVGYDRHASRKYPVVLGNTTFAAGNHLYQGRPNGPLWAQALANCGCFVVVVNRHGWSENIEEWGKPIMGLYSFLAENPEMDMSQVFLFGASAETQYLSKLANERPELWKGLILMNPGGLPELEEFPLTQPVPKMLISFGELERQQERLKHYQEEATKRGISVEVVMHKDASHWLQGQAAVLERTKAILRFVGDRPAQ